MITGWSKILPLTFLAGVAVIRLSDELFLVDGRGNHIVKSAAVPWILSSWSGPLIFGFVSVAGVAGWRAIERLVVAPCLAAEPTRRPWLTAAIAVVLISGGLGLGWRVMPLSRDHISWCFLIYGVSLAAVGVLLSRRQLLAFFLVGILGVAAEWVALDPALGWWTFAQRDLFGRVPAWELFVYGWAGILFDILALRVGKGEGICSASTTFSAT